MKPDEPTLAAPGTPPAEVEIDLDLVTGIVREQHRDLSSLAIRPVASGWGNSTWRLGDDFALRLPRRELSASLIRHEQRWLPSIDQRVSVPIPEPVRIGEPSDDYPWPWSVARWTHSVSGPGARLLVAVLRFRLSRHDPPSPRLGGALRRHLSRRRSRQRPSLYCRRTDDAGARLRRSGSSIELGDFNGNNLDMR